MFYRKTLYRLIVSGLVSILAQGAQALPLPDPPYETSTSTSSSWGGTWNSHIACTPIGSASNVVGATAVTQSALVHCIVTYPDSPAMEEGDCQLNIAYSRDAGLTTSGATQCQVNGDGSSTLTDVAYCGNASRGLAVSGTLDCNPTNNPSPPPICKGHSPCIANLDGIGDVPNGQCGTVFPASTEVPLAEGQVLSVSITTNDSTCTGQVIQAHSSIYTRFCNSGSFDPTIPARCLYGTGSNKQAASITGNTTVYLPIRIEVSPQTVNVDCSGNKDNGNVRFTVYGDANVDVTLIDQSTLSLEGVGINQPCTITDADADGVLDLVCSVDSCPDLGPILEAQRNADKTVTVDLTGELNSGTAIKGKDVIKTSP